MYIFFFHSLYRFKFNIRILQQIMLFYMYTVIRKLDICLDYYEKWRNFSSRNPI